MDRTELRVSICARIWCFDRRNEINLPAPSRFPILQRNQKQNVTISDMKYVGVKREIYL